MQLGPPIIGVSKNIQQIRDVIQHVAPTGLNVVICGESGVGKEVIAQNLYQQSPRNGKPFIKINCAALPEGLLESELFGYERGAFTGAEQKRKGKFQLAHGGVLLLDEIGDMSLPLQAKLLHVLQSGEFAPLGSEKDVKTDSWVIAATNHDLQQDINDGKFREDLYYRLNIIKIQIAPLRMRSDDIDPLIEFYLNQYVNQFENKNIILPNQNVIERLKEYHWPGNVRELQNVLKRMIVLGNGEQILAELLASKPNGATPQVENFNSEPVPHPPPPTQKSDIRSLLELDGNTPLDFETFSFKAIRKKAIDKVEKEIISYVLKKTGWNRSKASKILKISYKTLLYKISDLKIEPSSSSEKDFFI